MAYGEITSIELQNLEVLNTKSESGFRQPLYFSSVSYTSQ